MRRERSSVALICLWALALAACGEDEPLPLPSLVPPVVPGGLCSSPTTYCLDDSRVLICERRIWTERSCAAECADRGLQAHGCRREEFRGACICLLPDAGSDALPTACRFTPRRCEDSETLAVCLRSGIERRNCSSVCAELSPPRTSLGCQSSVPSGLFGADDCVCSFAGTPCDDGAAAICDGSRYLARCTAGVWQVTDCALGCSPSTWAECTTWATDAGAGCRCGE